MCEVSDQALASLTRPITIIPALTYLADNVIKRKLKITNSDKQYTVITH